MRYRSAFTKTELISAAAVACTAGEAKVVGKYKVEAGEIIEPGYGLFAGQGDATGRIYIALQNAAGAALNGTIRFSIWTPQNRHIMPLAEYRTETIASGSGDRTKMVEFPEIGVEITEDKQLVMEFISDTTDSIDKSKSTILMDITRTQA
jgi:hypothetical protein